LKAEAKPQRGRILAKERSNVIDLCPLFRWNNPEWLSHVRQLKRSQLKVNRIVVALADTVV
jgi:hypothetical protein